MSPREYIDHQNNMSDDEKERRREFFKELFDRADQKNDAVTS